MKMMSFNKSSTVKFMRVIKQIRIKDRKVTPFFQIIQHRKQFAKDKIIVKVVCFSLDPVMRVWLSGAKTNYRQVHNGDIFNCFGLGLIQQSQDQDLPVGSYLFGNTGTLNYFQLTEEKQRECFMIDKQLVEKYGPYKFVYLINNGLAAYAGFKILQPKQGQNIIVSTAAGATGLLLCHLLHKQKSKIIAISSINKQQYLKPYTNHIIDYKDKSHMIDQLSKIKFSKYFDNVGQSQLDIILSLIQNNGVLALCGAIQNYTNHKSGGINNYLNIITKRLKLQGINFSNQFPKALQIFDEYKSAQLLMKIINIKQFIEYFQQIFTKGGSIVGKIIVDPHLF